jgi:hypothetical protein
VRSGESAYDARVTARVRYLRTGTFRRSLCTQPTVAAEMSANRNSNRTHERNTQTSPPTGWGEEGDGAADQSDPLVAALPLTL